MRPPSAHGRRWCACRRRRLGQPGKAHPPSRSSSARRCRAVANRWTVRGGRSPSQWVAGSTSASHASRNSVVAPSGTSGMPGPASRTATVLGGLDASPVAVASAEAGSDGSRVVWARSTLAVRASASSVVCTRAGSARLPPTPAVTADRPGRGVTNAVTAWLQFVHRLVHRRVCRRGSTGRVPGIGRGVVDDRVHTTSCRCRAGHRQCRTRPAVPGTGRSRRRGDRPMSSSPAPPHACPAPRPPAAAVRQAGLRRPGLARPAPAEPPNRRWCPSSDQHMNVSNSCSTW